MRKRWLAVGLFLLVAVAGVLLATGPWTRATAGVGVEKEVELGATGGPNPGSVTLSRKGLERVRWVNRDQRGHTLLFTDWPFTEPPEPILVKAGEKSRWYTIYPRQQDGKFEYSIDPAIPGGSTGPPDPPEVVAGE